MTLLFANNAVSLLSASITLSAVAVPITPGTGVLFPSPGAGESFLLTIQQGLAYEIVECTARSGDTLTVVRGREGTAAQTWGVGAAVSMRPTAGTMAAFEQRERALASFAPINGPIVLDADPALGTHAARRSWTEAQIAAASDTLNARIASIAVVGEVKEYAGIQAPPPLHVWAAGQALSRSVYAELFEATTVALTVNLTAGSAVATIVSGSTFGLRPGVPLSLASHVPNGTTIASFVGGITMSAPATVSGTGLILRACPYGVGDNSTTFNVIDRRGTVGVGRDNMGGTTSGRVTQAIAGFDPFRVGAIGGDQRTQQHGHPPTDPGHGHAASFSGSAVLPNGVASFLFGPLVVSAAMTPGSANILDAGGQGVAVSGTVTVTPGTTGITIPEFGQGAAQNMQPSTVCNYIVFTNV